MELRSSLKVHRTTANLSHHIDEIEALCKGEKLAVTTDYIEVTYPLRADFEVSFKIPKDISKDEAQRLSSYFAHYILRNDQDNKIIKNTSRYR